MLVSYFSFLFLSFISFLFSLPHILFCLLFLPSVLPFFLYRIYLCLLFLLSFLHFFLSRIFFFFSLLFLILFFPSLTCTFFHSLPSSFLPSTTNNNNVIRSSSPFPSFSYLHHSFLSFFLSFIIFHLLILLFLPSSSTSLPLYFIPLLSCFFPSHLPHPTFFFPIPSYINHSFLSSPSLLPAFLLPFTSLPFLLPSHPSL